MERFYSVAFSNFADDEDFYDGNLDQHVSLPEGFALTIPTTLRAVVDEAIDAVMPDDIIVTYSPRGITKTAELDADLVRRFCKALWQHWRRNSDNDPIRDFGKNLFRSGFASIKMTPDWSLWPVLPDGELMTLKGSGGLKDRVRSIKELRAKHTPLTPRSLSPRCLMLDPTVGSRKLWVIERYEAATADIQDMYAQFEPDFGDFSDSYSRHKVWEFWSATHADYTGKIIDGRHLIFIDEKQVFAGDNPYGDLPYVNKYSGMGRESYDGKPEHKSVGFYTKQIKSLGLAEARRFSQFDAIMAQLAFPIGILPMDVDADSFDTSPGALNFVPDSVMEHADKIWLNAPIPDAQYLTSLQVIGGQLERGTTQQAIGGSGVKGQGSAAQLSMTTGQALGRLDQVKTTLEDTVAELFAMALFYIDRIFNDKVSVFCAEEGTPKYTLGPDNIKGHYVVSVEFQTNEEQDKLRKLAIANDAIVKGGLSPYDALTFAGFDNASELIARRLAYDVMQDPFVKKAIGRDMLKEWGIDADKVELEEQMEQGVLQKKLSDFMNMLQTGSLRDVGNPNTPTGAEPGGGPPMPPPPGMQLPPAMPPPGMPPALAGVGNLPPPGAQAPLAALAQQGQGPMPMPVGPPPMNPALQPPGMLQKPPGAP